MTCAHCGRQVPPGRYCAGCGGDQGAGLRDGRSRRHSFAAHPGEPVARVNVLSTLFPHLNDDRVHDFRWAFVAGLVSLILLYLGGLIVAAVILAALLVPALYLLYLYEAQVYGREPLSVLGVTAGGGLVLGLVVALILDHMTGVLSLAPTAGAVALLLLTVLAPMVQELIKPLPALLLRRRPALAESLDGLTLGVAAGLGFALGQTLVNLSPVILSLPFRVDPSAWIYPLVSLGVLLPILQGTCTGAFTTALWRRRSGAAGLLTSGVAVAIFAHVAFALGTELLYLSGPGQPAVLAWQGVVVGALILYTRAMLHAALLEEASDLGFSERSCAQCHERVVAGSFCPSCGVAMAASSRRPGPMDSPAAVGPGGIGT